jgi:preprotein translocase subunit Sec63
LLYIVKAYHEKEQGDKQIFELLEKKISESLTNNKEILLEEICAIADCLCNSKVFSREFQKLFEHVISQRIKDIKGNPKVGKYLYNLFYVSGMCSVGLMNVLHKAYAA